MRFIIELIKTAIGGGTTKLVIYGLFLVAFVFLLFKAYNVTKHYHYTKYVLPHVKVVRDSLSRSNFQLDSVSVKYWNLQEKAVLDSVLNKDISDRQQGLVRDLNNRVKLLKVDCRDMILVREKIGLFGKVKTIDSTVIIK